MPTKEVEGLRWEPRWISEMGCMRPCAKHAGREVSWPWLYGGTGYAFILNIHEGLCPSGWHVLDFPIGELGKNVGIESECFTPDGGHEFPSEEDMPRRQKEVFEAVCKAIDAGRPCYGYNLEIGDYYVIYGYDDVGYFYSGPMCDAGKGPLAWQKYGTEGDVPGLLCMGAVGLCEPAADAKTLGDALKFAVEHARSTNKPDDVYKRGLEGYDHWIAALKSGKVDAWGVPYNAACYHECRSHAVQFLVEAKAKLEGNYAELLDQAIAHYESVVKSLTQVTGAFPVQGDHGEHVKDETRIARAVEALGAAKEAETAGVAALEKLAAAMDAE